MVIPLGVKTIHIIKTTDEYLVIGLCPKEEKSRILLKKLRVLSLVLAWFIEQECAIEYRKIKNNKGKIFCGLSKENQLQRL